ncbi:hypothetical protein [Leptolyngbya sp. 7M]|uniref:hypothetical protein n=1 Tax=Leptolyngbya sp. 7M TaxID=2812896 RepID=UPI001B8D6F6D|nr:hypothetical protein [Leptolyngbya sp. 7M]QYO65713.1 hypothetical protein JVX88_02675 [Leptolyngbya sp. 7M]
MRGILRTTVIGLATGLAIFFVGALCVYFYIVSFSFEAEILPDAKNVLIVTKRGIEFVVAPITYFCIALSVASFGKATRTGRTIGLILAVAPFTVFLFLGFVADYRFFSGVFLLLDHIIAGLTFTFFVNRNYKENV